MFVTIGNTTVDLFISGLDRLPALGGDEFTVDNLVFCDQPLGLHMGGNGALSAYALARLGAAVTVCSAVGRDTLGDFVCATLAQGRVDTAGLLRSTVAATGTTTIITDRVLNRVSFHHPGAMQVYQVVDVPTEVWDQAQVVLASSFTLLPEWRPAGFAEVLGRVHSNGGTTALDIGPAIGRPAELDELSILLPDVDYFICNQHELQTCTGMESLDAGMEQILVAGAGCVVVKRGRHGAVLRQQGCEAWESPAFAVDARSTVGAGDSFNAGFLYAVHQGWDLSRAARFANAVAALMISASRGAPGAPTLAQVEAFLDHS